MPASFETLLRFISSIHHPRYPNKTRTLITDDPYIEPRRGQNVAFSNRSEVSPALFEETIP
jgi:hypothetical protein